MPLVGRRRGWASGALVALTGAAVLASAGSAGAEALPIPLTGPSLISGHGYGHGHGMSQWGAYGAATKGLTHQQILAFYYPGTAQVTTAPGPLRARLSGVSTSSLTVAMRPGLKFVIGSKVLALGGGTASQPVDRWRLLVTAGALDLQWRAGGVWSTGSSYRGLTGTPGFVNPTATTVRVERTDGTLRDYPDRVQGTLSGSSLVTVNATSMERYLRGVIPNEMPASWPAAALRSQSVAARTYAAYEQQHATSSLYDVCDTTSCQVYFGYADYSASGTLTSTRTHPNADAAVKATTGVMIAYQHYVAFTQFSAANGGWMAAGSVPYLVAKADPYDGVVANNANSWTVSDTTLRTDLQNARPAIGTLHSVVVTRDGHGEWGGRIRGVTLVGSSGTATLPWDELRSRLGLKSEWFTVTNGDFLRRDTTANGKASVFGRTASGTLSRMTLTGTALSAPTTMGTGWSTMKLLGFAGDLNGNGSGDLIARDAADRLWCYPVPQTGTLGTRTELTNVPATLDRITGVGDVTSDGRSDIVGLDPATGTLWLYAGNGACGVASSRTSLGGNFNPFGIIVGAADANRDGRADLWARDASGVLWTYKFDGAGRITGRTNAGGGWNAMTDLVAVGDVNGGGGADLLARDNTGKTWLYPGKGDGTFGVRLSVSGDVSTMTILR